MDDEVAVLDSRLMELESQLADAEMHLLEVRQEWDELYPYETLEWSLETIQRVVGKLLDLDPEDLEAQALLAEADLTITPKLMEPDVFYLK